MKTSIHSLSLLLVVFFLMACNDKTAQVEALQSEVIKVHDEVMPKMDKLMKLQSQVKTINSDTTKRLLPDAKIIATNLISNLNKADEGMMNWMRNYDSMMQGMSDDEKLNYLKNQEIAIKKVKQDMLSAISEATEFIEQYEN